MLSVVVGTTNPAKIAKLRQLLLPITVTDLPAIVRGPAIEELGGTFAEIAQHKAHAWSRWLAEQGIDIPVIVTDGGLTIPALGDRWDALRTHRFAGTVATPRERAAALMRLAGDLRGEDRRIGWTESAAVVAEGGVERVFTAEGRGGYLAETIRPGDLRNDDGFWVPALWLCPECGMSRLSDLTDDEAATRRDHWDVIGEELRRFLMARLGPGERLSRRPFGTGPHPGPSGHRGPNPWRGV